MDALADARNLVTNVRDFGAWDTPPASVRDASDELHELKDALLMIAAQGAEQRARLPPAELAAWHARAARAQAIFGRRKRFLGQWIAGQTGKDTEAELTSLLRKQRAARTSQTLDMLGALPTSVIVRAVDQRVWHLEVVFAHASRLVDDFTDAAWDELAGAVEDARVALATLPKA